MTGSVLYRRTQIAWPTIVPLLVVAAILIPLFLSMQLTAAIWITVGTYALILLLFATLTVTVTSDGMEAAFGVGAVRKEVPFTDLVSFTRLRMRWFNGWGIHTYPGGTLYNASGLSAVELLLTSGRYVAIGTAEPDAVAAALQQATGKTEGIHDFTRATRWGIQHTAAVVVACVALVVVGVSIYLGLREPTVIVGEDSLYVSNGLYRNVVPFASIESMKLDDRIPMVERKLNGLALGRTLRGRFNVDGWGTSSLYVNAGAPPFVVIETPKTFVAVNFTDPQRTRSLYTDLKTHAVRFSR